MKFTQIVVGIVAGFVLAVIVSSERRQSLGPEEISD